MSHSLSLLLLAFTLSLDSGSVGFTYGLRNLRIPIKSIVVIALCSAVVMMISMGIGHGIAQVFSPVIAKRIGGIVLIAIGAWVLYQFFQSDKKDSEQIIEEKTLLKFEIKSLGIVIQILRKPTMADFDKSGTISGIEALLLGLALSLDSFGAGIGASMLGYSPLIMAALVAVMSSVFLAAGMKAGQLFSHSAWLQKLTFLPGVLLIMIGIWKM
ncbi:sporulation membrane protein YtaF [Bacillus sp. 165]|uniref:sporulation membrane protein YtaF n=1 Tax=Bacillus sp. 165 TaxID=1529117 RepID=UPI001ADC8546|nr:sporulation membrane protein YtaF [Bacillus sp. 165]MBO9130603.1 sporulation membrane protein YtaF [Bacillus sp. 165]